MWGWFFVGCGGKKKDPPPKNLFALPFFSRETEWLKEAHLASTRSCSERYSRRCPSQLFEQLMCVLCTPPVFLCDERLRSTGLGNVHGMLVVPLAAHADSLIENCCRKQIL